MTQICACNNLSHRIITRDFLALNEAELMLMVGEENTKKEFKMEELSQLVRAAAFPSSHALLLLDPFRLPLPSACM